MSMSIYEIDQRILALVDPETGEIMDDAAFDELQMERNKKIENVACWIKNLSAEITAIRAEEIALAERRKAMERKADGLKNYLARTLDGEKFSTPKCAVNWRKTTKVEITDMRSVADWCEGNGYGDLITYPAPAVSKTELGKLLRADTQVPGAELIEQRSMGVK